MWKQRYRKTFLANQAIILTVCLVLSIHWKVPFLALLVFIAMMELGALFGAMWTTRLVGKFDRAGRDKFDLKVM
jgi:hypothetical protein